MMLTELTTVPDSALPLAELRDHIRLGTGFADESLQDALLLSYLRSAMAAIEGRTGKIVLERTFVWVLFEWRDKGRQPLPLAPVNAVNQIVFEDEQGVETPAPSGWRLVPDTQRPTIDATGGTLPAIPATQAAKIYMTAGFGPEWSNVPADLRQAVLMLAAHFYEYRHEAQMPDTAMPYGVTSLIERYRTVRVFMGSGS